MTAFNYILGIQKIGLYSFLFLTLYVSFNMMPSIFNNHDAKLQNIVNLIRTFDSVI
jgi:hypothetical protein